MIRDRVDIVMKNCTECNYKFKFGNRLKTICNLKGNLKCHKCKTVYKPKSNIYRGIYYGVVTFTSLTVSENIILKDSMLKFILYIIIVMPILLLFEILPHKWHKYEKIG